MTHAFAGTSLSVFWPTIDHLEPYLICTISTMADRVQSEEPDHASGSADIIDPVYLQHVAQLAGAREQEKLIYSLPATPVPFENALTSDSALRLRLSNRQLMESLPLDGNALRAQLRERGVCAEVKSF